jgi:hypothetical protein
MKPDFLKFIVMDYTGYVSLTLAFFVMTLNPSRGYLQAVLVKSKTLAGTAGFGAGYDNTAREGHCFFVWAKIQNIIFWLKR